MRPVPDLRLMLVTDPAMTARRGLFDTVAEAVHERLHGPAA